MKCHLFSHCCLSYKIFGCITPASRIVIRFTWKGSRSCGGLQLGEDGKSIEAAVEVEGESAGAVVEVVSESAVAVVEVEDPETLAEGF